MADNSSLPVATAPQPPAVTTDPRREYVAGGAHLPWLATMAATLPPWIDAKTRDFGDDFYERMLLDPQVSSCVHLWKMGVLAQRPVVIPAVKDETDLEYAQAREYADYIQRAIDRVPGFRSQKLYNLLDGAAYGNKVAEIVLERAEWGADQGQLTLKALKVKHRRTLAFVVDAFMNVLGFTAVIPGRSYTLAFPMQWSAYTVDGNKNLLPRERFCVFTFRMEDEDPRGASLLSSVYAPWWGKLQIYPEYLKYLAQFADPSLWGTTAEGAVDVYPRDENGALVPNALPISPQQIMLMAMQAIRNGSAVAFPFGSELHALEMQGAGEPFLKADEFFDNQIAKGILGSTLATEQSMHGSRAQSQVHQDAVGLSIGHGRNLLEDTLNGDLVPYLLRLRYGVDALALKPSISLGEVQQEDRAAIMTAAAALVKAGKLPPSHYVYITTELLGFPAPTAEEMETLQEQFEAAAVVPGDGADDETDSNTSDE